MSDIKVRGPKGSAKTLSFGGESYTANKQGIFSVPTESWEHLQRHGFTIEGQEEPEETEEERAAREAAEAEAARQAAEAEAAAKAAADGGGKP